MQTLKGIVRGNTIAFLDDDVSSMDGEEVYVTLSSVQNNDMQKNEKQKAFEYLESIRKPSDTVIDCKKELEAIQSERYESLN